MISVSFTTHNPTTKALADADALPAGTVMRNGTPDATVPVTVENTGTGRYKAAFTVPGTYADGDTIEIYITAAVAGVPGGGIVWRGMIDVAFSQTYSAIMAHRLATEMVLDKLGDMIQLDEASSPQFTANALEQVPKSGYSLATAPPSAAEIKTALEADGGKLDHVWETTEDNAGVRRFSAAALAESPTAAGAFTDEDRAALAAAKAVTDAIATMIVIDGAVYQFTENALELAPTGGGVSFGSIAFALQSTVGAGQVADGSITLYQNAAIAGIVIVVTDEEGDAIDLSAATLALVVYKDPATVLWSLTEAAGQLTVGGASNNQVTLAANGSYTATPGHYRYALWDTATDLVRARGVLTIEREASAPQG